MPFQVERFTEVVGVIRHSDGSTFRILAPGKAEELTKRIARVLNACEQIPDKQIAAGVAPLAQVNEDAVGTPIVITALPTGDVKDAAAKGNTPREIAEAFFGMSIDQIEATVREIIEKPAAEAA